MVITFSFGTQISWVPAATMIHWSVIATSVPAIFVGWLVERGQATTWISTNLPTGGVPGEESPEFWAAAGVPGRLKYTIPAARMPNAQMSDFFTRQV